MKFGLKSETHHGSFKISLSALKEVTKSPRVGIVQITVVTHTTTVAILLEKSLRPGLWLAIFRLLMSENAPSAVIGCYKSKSV